MNEQLPSGDDAGAIYAFARSRGVDVMFDVLMLQVFETLQQFVENVETQNEWLQLRNSYLRTARMTKRNNRGNDLYITLYAALIEAYSAEVCGWHYRNKQVAPHSRSEIIQFSFTRDLQIHFRTVLTKYGTYVEYLREHGPDALPVLRR